MKLSIALIAGALLAAASPALAQAPPGGVPFGAGLQRGVEQLNNSGEAGFTTLLRRGGKVQIVTQVLGGPAGRMQYVSLQRGKTCDGLESAIVMPLGTLHDNVTARATVVWSEDKLVSGNYNVVVHSHNTPTSQAVACGHLYR